MERADKGLAFMMQYENVAWYDGGEVRILDRRVYPRRVQFVTCRTHREVAQALTDMVTQSTGPFTAAAMGMALAAWECRDRTAEQQVAYLEQAMDAISHARPTTVGRMQLICGGCLEAAKAALERGVDDVALAIRDYTVQTNNRRYSRVGQMAAHLVEKFPDNGTVMTQCFGETIVAMMLKKCREQGKTIRLFCPETRPYFQGARLTALEMHAAGLDTTLLCDNAASSLMQTGKVNIIFVGCDRVARNGDAANKIGTSAVAILAKHYGIPFYVCAPSSTIDMSLASGAEIPIEQRAAEEITEMWYKKRMAPEGVGVYNPAFDVTDHSLITGIITERGICTAPFEDAFRALGF